MKHLIVLLTAIFCTEVHSYDLCVSDEECFVALTLKNALIYSVTTPDAIPQVEVDYNYKTADGLIMALAMMESNYALRELSSLTNYYFGDRYEDALDIAIKHKGKAMLEYLQKAKEKPSACGPKPSRYCREEFNRKKYINRLIDEINANS